MLGVGPSVRSRKQQMSRKMMICKVLRDLDLTGHSSHPMVDHHLSPLPQDTGTPPGIDREKAGTIQARGGSLSPVAATMRMCLRPFSPSSQRRSISYRLRVSMMNLPSEWIAMRVFIM